jgi:hypothetical protein
MHESELCLRRKADAKCLLFGEDRHAVQYPQNSIPASQGLCLERFVVSTLFASLRLPPF